MGKSIDFFKLPSFNTFVKRRSPGLPLIIYFVLEKSKKEASGVRLKPGDDEGGHNMQFLQGLTSNLRHITTNGFGALRKRLGARRSNSFCGCGASD